VGGNTHDAPREAAIDVKRLLARDGMGADDRVLGLGIAFLVLHAKIRVLPAIALAVVDRGQAREILLHPIGQGLVGGIHAGEERVAAERRAGLYVEDAAERRLGIAGDVAVPAFA